MKRNAVRGLVLDDRHESLVSSSGALMINETIRVAGLRLAVSRALRPWRATRASHDSGKLMLDVATAVALGGDCLADVAAVRAQCDLYGIVASDPTLSRLFAGLTVDASTADAVVAVLRSAPLAPVTGSGHGVGRWRGRREPAMVGGSSLISTLRW